MNLGTLDEAGWSVAGGIRGEAACREHLLRVARSLGRVVCTRAGTPSVDVLRPTEAAARNSLSGMHALGSFPYHTDVAHLPVPHRFVLLACVDPGGGGRPTTLLDTRDVPLDRRERELLTSSPLRVVNGRASFFSTVLRRGRAFVRYDPGCMRPVTADGAAALSVYQAGASRAAAVDVEWRRGDLLVVDNWRVLHGRGSAARRDAGRTLLRAYVAAGPTEDRS